MADGQSHREQPTPVWPSAIRHPLSAIHRDVGERHPTCFGSKEPSVRVRPSRLTDTGHSSPGRPTVQDTALIRRKRRFDSFPGDSAESRQRSAVSCQPEQIDQDDNSRRTLICSFPIAANALRPHRGRGVTAAQRAFNPHGEGSNPSDLNGSGQPSAISQSDPAWLKADC